ncbi:WD repeat and FYVE domain-containing protein 3 [Geosmithia morbida]|uniref:Beige protein homolog 1 n=1 Tax=Geosmithia morbida TaxID=1094350 RepID=A0A9P5D4L4_9HYPO|nr:WD repeat and FYVE domain-containing protein 3 [Geosmithia morbida]KAF4122915.1 WD repeat and FYVE domain-containing protein 3 [Geosmithia morbida]
MPTIIPRRYRSATASSHTTAVKPSETLTIRLEQLEKDTARPSENGYPDPTELSLSLHALAEDIGLSVTQDDFRHARGFERILNVLRAFSGYYNPDKRSASETLSLLKLLKEALAILSSALRDHSGNRRFFKYKVDGGGWESLEQVIASIGLGGTEPDSWATCHLFGLLLSFCLDDESIDLLCQSIAKTLRPDIDYPTQDAIVEEGEEQWDLLLSRSAYQVGPSVRELVNDRTVVRHPEILRAVVSFWSALPREAGAEPTPGSLVLLETLLAAASKSTHNQVAVHSTGVLSQFIRAVFEPDQVLTPMEREKALEVCKLLMELGVNQPSDTQFLLTAPGQEASEFCLDMTSRHSGPPFFQFDLSLHGYCSLELPSLGRTFPPQTTPGYTFAAWIRVDNYDPSTHTTLFGVFDVTQTCFLLMYLEKDTRNFILQTSVSSNRPSVRFKAIAFEEKKWYHVAIVHRRPKALSSSKAALYVNGEFTEQIRCNYPQMPPLSTVNKESFASFNSTNNKTNPVQAFVGTPRDLSNKIGPAKIFSRWSLASLHLFEDVLSDDYLAVQCGLGPRYQGNFQDSLGGFQTYDASAALGLRNEFIHSGANDHSDILKAVRDKASTLLPESKILLSILPTATFPDDVHFLNTGLLRSLPRPAARSLFRTSNQEGAPLAINGAVSCISDALFKAQGIASFRGGPVATVPSYMDENLWRLAGFTPLALKLLERASTVEETTRSLEMLIRCISNSWRNSEAMERDNGYGIMGMILRFKLGYGGSSITDPPVARLQIPTDERDSLAFQTLSLILGFVGYSHESPIESFIVNPLAYRILLIDLDIWRKSAPRIQELYYKQFVTFAVSSKFHEFNRRRLIRMRIVKRLLDAVKGEAIAEETMPHFLGAFDVLVKSNLSQEVMRSLALFITHAFHSPPTSLSRTPKPSSSSSRPSTATTLRGANTDLVLASNGPSNFKYLPKKTLGTKILVMYSDILCEKGNLSHIKKFARTVTNKWLLYLLAEDDIEIVVHGCKILARLLVAHGSTYTAKFANKSGGFIIMANRLRKFWDVPTLWPICLSILFGYDVSEFDFGRNFDLSSLVNTFGERKVVYPDSLQIVTSMFQHGFKEVMRYQEDADSPAKRTFPKEDSLNPALLHTGGRPRARSMDLAETIENRSSFSGPKERVLDNTSNLHTMIKFFMDLHSRSADFRDFALSSDWIRLLLVAIYPAVVSVDAVTPDVELNSGSSPLTFGGSDVIIRSMGGGSAPTPIVRASVVNAAASPQSTPPKGTPLRRASSFVLLTAQQQTHSSNSDFSSVRPSPPTAPIDLSANKSNALFEGFMKLIAKVFMDQLFVRKEFPGFSLFLKVPPGFQEHHAYFESFILRRIMAQVSEYIKQSDKAVCEPRILTNLARLSLHLTEAVFEGWFLNGDEDVMEFNGMLLEFLDRPDIERLKSVRLCSQAVSTIRSCFIRIILLKLSDLDGAQTSEVEAKKFMDNLAYWQMSILTCFNSEDDYLKLFWYQLYVKLVDNKPSVRSAAVNFMRVILVQKPAEGLSLVRSVVSPDQRSLIRDFEKLTEMDDDTFVDWVDKHRPALDTLFLGGMTKTWEEFVETENHKTLGSAKSQLPKRKEILKMWLSESETAEKTLVNHEIGNSAWMKSIYTSEHFKYQRLVQDQQDDLAFLIPAWRKMERDLRRPGAVFSEPTPAKWKLDRTEGRNRMRLRLLPDYSPKEGNRPSRREGSSNALHPSAAGRSAPSMSPAAPASPKKATLSGSPEKCDDGSLQSAGQSDGDQNASEFIPEDDFEMVDDPNEPNDEESFEDKNRKVMRRLEHGDQVQAAYNVSRITGLEACEGILIVGKDALYIMDNVFQCANGDIVNVWQAPPEERDPFIQIVTGAKTMEKRQNAGGREQESRHWRWQDVISISKRRFLFRDVAIEVFFTDGRSYLLTQINSNARNELFSKMMAKAPHTSTASALPNPEDAWRLEVLKVVDEAPQGIGSKLGTLFNSAPWTPIMKRWQRGEVSNFHYLMMVNTLAGRTFNDLTQYPVFPWIIADYTSEDLDLDDPATFRDLSRPMGAQTQGRVPGYIETYSALQDIGQDPFHYGTHYSSAMIVSSYLIRLPPFVHSYLLVQGDKFDHADRLFQSIPQAWDSASRKNRADVRELTPEFFCLPEFLTNINDYDFGERQSTGIKVNNVELPLWAKGDPKIFIAKHREALESPYVSENLHHWIDLVFGYKQQGEAAVESLNVFHHLSYAGASDLDGIKDANERAIKAGVIHNFGQTPHQVFPKAHPARESVRCPVRRLDTSVFSLRCQPNPLVGALPPSMRGAVSGEKANHLFTESRERVASLLYAPKIDRLLCASPLRLHFPPYDKYMEWGYADHSIRFFYGDNRKLAGVFENLHIGQISCAVFADSKTLITAGEDCVISVFMVQTSPNKSVEVTPKASLFGHKTPVTTIAVSKAFSTFVTVSLDGQALVWDMNQLGLIRKLPLVRPVEDAKINNVTGEILLCSGPNILLYSLNGSLICDVNVCNDADDYVHCCAFYEGAADEWLEDQLIFTGHRKGRVNVWRKGIQGNKWTLDFLRSLDHVDNKENKPGNTEAGITCITPMPTCVYTGDDNGRVYEWTFSGRDR